MASGVLEHVPRFVQALNELSRVASKFLIVHRLPISLDGKFLSLTKTQYKIETARYSFAFHEIVELLNERGFVIINSLDTYRNLDLPERSIVFKRREFL